MDTVSNIPGPEQKKGGTFKHKLAGFFADLYKIHLFILRFFKEAFMPPFEFKEVGTGGAKRRARMHARIHSYVRSRNVVENK